MNDTIPNSSKAYDDLTAWVEDWLAPTIRRPAPHSIRWCRRWWVHPEAVARLDALWRAWEQARTASDRSAYSLWWVVHFDPHWAALTSINGPFVGCGPTSGDELEVSCDPGVRLPTASWADGAGS